MSLAGVCCIYMRKFKILILYTKMHETRLRVCPVRYKLTHMEKDRSVLVYSDSFFLSILTTRPPKLKLCIFLWFITWFPHLDSPFSSQASTQTSWHLMDCQVVIYFKWNWTCQESQSEVMSMLCTCTSMWIKRFGCHTNHTNILTAILTVNWSIRIALRVQSEESIACR